MLLYEHLSLNLYFLSNFTYTVAFEHHNNPIIPLCKCQILIDNVETQFPEVLAKPLSYSRIFMKGVNAHLSYDFKMSLLTNHTEFPVTLSSSHSVNPHLL